MLIILKNECEKLTWYSRYMTHWPLPINDSLHWVSSYKVVFLTIRGTAGREFQGNVVTSEKRTHNTNRNMDPSSPSPETEDPGHHNATDLPYVTLCRGLPRGAGPSVDPVKDSVVRRSRTNGGGDKTWLRSSLGKLGRTRTLKSRLCRSFEEK